jgi:hypothetical protein
MSFVFPVLLGGLVLAGVPILLHLIMRQKPKMLLFPAFRFLVQKHRTNQRKLRLRHLLLLILRVMLLVAICLALARPKLLQSGLNLSTDRPVAAVFLFDTSYSMGYKTSDQVTRLEEAKKRGLELVDELPEGSRFAILDSADAVLSRGEWLASRSQARERIKGLRPQAAGAAVSFRLEDAFRMFADLALGKEDEARKDLPRLLCVFSDRTRASWDTGRLSYLFGASDQVPPTLAGLELARGAIPNLIDSLKALRTQLPPPAGQDYPEQPLMDALEALRDRIPGLTAADLPPDADLNKLLREVREPARALLVILQKMADTQAKDASGTPAAKEFQTQLLQQLHTVLGGLRGVYGLWIDVGVDNPADLAIIDIEFPRQPNGQMRQLFRANESFEINVQVQATGKDYNADLTVRTSGGTESAPVVVKAGERQATPFKIDPDKLNLLPGLHQFEVSLKQADLLAFNNVRYATFAIREPRRVLVLCDRQPAADDFVRALQATGYSPTVKDKLKEPAGLDPYHAVYLFDVARPTNELWDMLKPFVAGGRSLGIIPPGDKNVDAYNKGLAQDLMPGVLKAIVVRKPIVVKGVTKENGVAWDLRPQAVLQHPMMRPFRDWKDQDIDIIKFPAKVFRYWDVEPAKDKSTVVVHYADDKNRPALVERQFGGANRGRVLLFTTTLDPRQPRWNDYLESTTSWYVVLTGLATKFLVGDTEEPNLNFQSGQAAAVKLPVTPRFPAYSLRGPNLLEPVAVADQQTQLVLKQAVAPGNYGVEGFSGDNKPSQRVAAFSVNVPAEESDLTRVPVASIQNLLGADAVLPVERRANIHDALQGHWSQPIELFPFLMVLLLLVLALENLLANKFYKREADEGEQKG